MGVSPPGYPVAASRRYAWPKPLSSTLPSYNSLPFSKTSELKVASDGIWRGTRSAFPSGAGSIASLVLSCCSSLFSRQIDSRVNRSGHPKRSLPSLLL